MQSVWGGGRERDCVTAIDRRRKGYGVRIGTNERLWGLGGSGLFGERGRKERDARHDWGLGGGVSKVSQSRKDKERMGFVEGGRKEDELAKKEREHEDGRGLVVCVGL
jgi:hypothetical protein